MATAATSQGDGVPLASASRVITSGSEPRSKEDSVARLAQDALIQRFASVTLDPAAAHLGHFGDPGCTRRSAIRLRPVAPLEMEGVPGAGFVGTITWCAPLSLVHEALFQRLGLQHCQLSLGYQGRDVEPHSSLTSIGAVSSSRYARDRCGDKTVELVFYVAKSVGVDNPDALTGKLSSLERVSKRPCPPS